MRTTHFVVVAMKRLGGGPARLGMAVSRKAGIAVFRNRLRRILREIFRRSRAVQREGEGFDFIVIAGERARDLTTPRLSDVAEEVLPALRTARLRAVDRQRAKENDEREKPALSQGSSKESDG